MFRPVFDEWRSITRDRDHPWTPDTFRRLCTRFEKVQPPSAPVVSRASYGTRAYRPRTIRTRATESHAHVHTLGRVESLCAISNGWARDAGLWGRECNFSYGACGCLHEPLIIGSVLVALGRRSAGFPRGFSTPASNSLKCLSTRDAFVDLSLSFFDVDTDLLFNSRLKHERRFSEKCWNFSLHASVEFLTSCARMACHAR